LKFDDFLFLIVFTFLVFYWGFKAGESYVQPTSNCVLEKQEIIDFCNEKLLQQSCRPTVIEREVKYIVECEKAKYDIIIIPSNQSLAESIAAETYFVLDP